MEMHELAIAKGLVKTVLSKFDNEKMVRIIGIRVVAGGMYDYEEKWLQKYMDGFSEGTPLEGAYIKLEKKPVTFKCSKCGYEFPMDLKRDGVDCPGCGSEEYTMVSGREFYVENMEVQWKEN